METLIATLKKETQGLKTQYLEMTRVWATAQLERNRERRLQAQADSCKGHEGRFGIKEAEGDPVKVYDYQAKEYTTRPKRFLPRDEFYREQKFLHSPLWTWTDEYITRQVEAAEKHYEQSIVKLAARIEKKGLNQAKLTTVTAHVGVNIETTLTDGELTVRAWTIIAGGPVQRPHYRYLIK